jgi:DNA-binding XRE family transcriptional regulator
MKNVETKERFVRLRALGVPYSEIGKELDVTKKTLISWEPELREDIKKERAAEIEHLRAVYWGEKRGRIDLLTERQKRLHEEERKRDLSEIPVAKVMELERQTSEQLKKEIRSLPVQISHGALSYSPPACETANDAMTSPEGLDDGQLATGPLATLAQGDIRDMAHAILAEQAGLKEVLYEIANDAASESVQVAAIRTIDAISGRMLALVQSMGVIATLSDERQIDEVLAGWAARDSRELMDECCRADNRAAHLADEAVKAFQSGDLETVERLFSELDERKHQYAIERMRDAILQVRCPPTETGSNGDKAKGRAGTRSDLYFSSS